MRLTKIWLIALILTICGTAAFASCTTNDDNPSEQAVESLYVHQLQRLRISPIPRFLIVAGDTIKAWLDDALMFDEKLSMK